MTKLLRAFLQFVPVFAFVLSPTLLISQTEESFIESGWNKLRESNFRQAETFFTQALEKNPKSLRANLGLMYFYDLIGEDAKSFERFSTALATVEDNAPYAFARLTSGTFQSNLRGKKPQALALLEKLSQSNSDKSGTLRAMAEEQIGLYYQNIGKYTEANEHFAKMTTINDWRLLGPFESPSGSGFIKSFPPESNVDFSGQYVGVDGEPISWFTPTSNRYDLWVDFNRFYRTNGVFYAASYVYLPKDQLVSVRVGTSGAFRCFVDGAEVLQSEDEYNNDLDTYIAEMKLSSGWHQVLMKVSSSKISRCNFMVRLVTPTGDAIEGLKSSIDWHAFTKRTTFDGKVIDNFAEEFFRKKIEQDPEFLENYLLLSESYLRNDKGEQAEIVLRDALLKSPENIVVLEQMMQAFIRNEKQDQLTTTLETLFAKDSTVVSALTYKLNEAQRNNNYDQAEALLQKLIEVTPQEEERRAQRYNFLAEKKDPTMMDYLDECFEKYPNNYLFVVGKAFSLAYRKNNLRDAVDLLRNYNDDNFSLSAVNIIGGFAKTMQNMELWKEMKEVERRSTNDAPSWYLEMMQEYKKQDNDEKAIEMANSAFERMPPISIIYETLGDIERKRSNTKQAIEYYKKQMAIDIGNASTRRTIRELEGKKPIWQTFTNFNIDSLIKNSPNVSEYEEDKSVVLLEDNKLVLYADGSQEGQVELLVRVVNQEGIDQWKESGFGGYIEKAVVIKPNGTEIRADQSSDGQVVFKQLEEGDCLYVRNRYSRIESGAFRKFFERRFYYDGSTPYRVIRVAVLTSEGTAFTWKTRGIKNDPQLISTPDGIIHDWTELMVPAIRQEASMPNYDDVAKYLECSNVPSWKNVSDWYTDLTYLKTKPTYEVKQKVKELLGDDPKKLSEEEIVARVYRFITDSIRYSFVPFRQSGYIPQKARDVLITKIGDCKDVATLGISMLGVVGIKADYALVLTRTSELTKQMPCRNFDHVIARVHMKSGFQYLDLTASNYPIGYVPSGDLEAFSLVIDPTSKESQYLERKLFKPTTINHSCTATLSDLGELSAKRVSTYGGIVSAYFRHEYRSKGKKEVEKGLTETLSNEFPNVKLKSFSFKNLDNLEPTVALNEEYSSTNYGTDAGQYMMIKIPFLTGSELDEAFSYEKRTYPMEFGMEADTVRETVVLTLPEGMQALDMKPETKLTSELADYTLRHGVKGNVLTSERIFAVKSRLISPDKYADVKEFYNKMVKEDNRQILIGKVVPKKGKR